MTPGDVILCHNKDLVGKLIRLGERIRFHHDAGARYNHVALCYKWDAEARDWLVIQATGHGVTNTAHLSSLGEFTRVACPLTCDPDKAVEFAEAQVGDKYGFLTILSIAITILTPIFLNVMLANTWICSALGAEALRYGGWLQSWPDIYQVTPANVADALSPPAPVVVPLFPSAAFSRKGLQWQL